MSQKNKKKLSGETREHVEITTKEPHTKRTAIIIVVSVIAVIMAIVGIGSYIGRAKFRQTVITVGDQTIRMDYFLRRAKSIGDPMSTLQVLANEAIIKQEAPKLGVSATPEDINNELRNEAQGESGNITDREFQEWYRQQLNDSGLSDAEFKEAVRVKVLADKLQVVLADKVPLSAEQIHVSIISVGDYETAGKLKERIDKGEPFADVAKEGSLDPSGENGGDLGWLPRGVMSSTLFDDKAFALTSGQVSEIYSENEGFHIIKLIERSDSRLLEEQHLNIIRGNAMNTWILQTTAQYTSEQRLKYNFNSEIYAWMNYQLQKSGGGEQQQ